MLNYQITPTINNISRNAIVFAINNAYAQYCAAAIQSLAEHTSRETFYDIIIFEADISERNKRLLDSMIPENFSLRFFDVSSVIYDFLGKNSLKTNGYVSVETYYRLLIPIIMREYERVLYLDADICIVDNFHDLFSLTIGSNQIAGVIDAISQMLAHYPKTYKHFREDLNLKNPEHYFNAGLVLFNIGSIDKDDYIEKLKDALKIRKLDYNDQDILNVIFQGKTYLYSSKFNTQTGALPLIDKITDQNFKDEYLVAIKNPTILHFTGERKPWDDPHKVFSEIFWQYERKTPFYEECLLSSVNKNYVSQTQLKNVNSRFSIYFRYLFYKLLNKCSSGKTKEKFEKRYLKYKAKILDIQKYSTYK